MLTGQRHPPCSAARTTDVLSQSAGALVSSYDQEKCDVINFVRQIADSTTNTARLQEVKTKFFIKLSQEELSPGHMNEPVFTVRKPYMASWGAWPEHNTPL